MFQGIEAVGADTYNYGAKTIGSVLVNRMTACRELSLRAGRRHHARGVVAK